jgi:hypothetical protein
VHIFVNADRHEITSSKVTYADICRLAYGPGAEKHILTITYHSRRGADLFREGILSLGKEVEVDDGMRFTCMDTSAA